MNILIKRQFGVFAKALHENPLGLPRINRQNTKLPVKHVLPNVKKVVLVSSGKGGVGKSTVAANLAIALRNSNLNVGVLDADIFGPSIPKLFNLKGEPRLSYDGKLLPMINYGIQTMSMGYLLPTEDNPVVWRGAMVQKATQQLLFDVAWSNLDLLIVDMPPGTGDVQLTMSQVLKIDGAVIVSTSQDLALLDVKKGIAMFQKVNVPIIGLVENMSVFVCPNCNHEEHLFGQDGVLNQSDRLGIEFLGSIPLNRQICNSSDEGFPVALDKDSKLGSLYGAIATKVKNSVNA
ncbi:unnamed protein product [Ambrosiozyma monospora]|uniref:Unnamed protein product n=1 Tax=Ambrosiozyma monospora TaxID=43982 RepID=A0ACB5TJI5_AMBMO|nr:unnamed protein product [Ambrosiozyma monospora]